MPRTTARPTIDEFIELFLAALVLRRKTYIHISGNEADAERRRMHSLFDFLERACQERYGDDYDHFLIEIRNECAPSPIGAFDGFKHLLASKQSYLVSLDFPWCTYYKIDLQQTTAEHTLERAAPRMREFVSHAADAYMADMQG